MDPHAALAMPNAPEEVTLGWLQTIFADTTISSFTITQQRLFETSSKLYITLGYEADDGTNAAKPRHVLLKGGFNPAMFAVPGYKPLLLGAYTREVDVFTRYARTLPADSGIHLPKVWWAAASPDQAILVMEDLDKAGFAFGDATRTYGLVSVMKGVEQLAALHARAWGWTPEDHPWLAEPIYDNTMRGLLAMWDQLVLGEGRPRCQTSSKTTDSARHGPWRRTLPVVTRASARSCTATRTAETYTTLSVTRQIFGFCTGRLRTSARCSTTLPTLLSAC